MKTRWVSIITWNIVAASLVELPYNSTQNQSFHLMHIEQSHGENGHVSQKQIDQDICEYLCGPSASRIRIQDAEKLLSSFIDDVKNYVCGSKFNYPGFIENATRLKHELMHLENFLSTTSLTSELYDSFSFAKRIYSVAEQSAGSIEKFTNPNSAADNVLYKTIEVKLALFGLFDSLGSPNIRVQGFTDQMVSLWNRLSFLRVVFDDLSTVTLDTRLEFEDQATQAEEIMEELASQVWQWNDSKLES